MAQAKREAGWSSGGMSGDTITPPQNLEAEQAVLGAILIEGAAINQVMEILTADDFYKEAHRKIFKAMINLARDNKPIDLLTLFDYLKSSGKLLEEVGESSYLTYLTEIVPVTENVQHYAEMVKDAARRRKHYESALRLAQAVRGGDAEVERAMRAAITVGVADTPSSTRVEIDYPAPLNGAAYYGLAGEIVRFIEPHSEADPVSLLMNLIISVGSVTGRGAWHNVGSDTHYCNLFVALVGDSAKARKGMSWNSIYSIFERVDPEWAKERVQNGLSSGEGLIAHVKDSVLDKDGNVVEGVHDKRLLVHEGELVQVLKVIAREGNTLSPNIRNAWDGKKLQAMTKRDSIKAEGASISIIGHITKQELLRYTSETEAMNGFSNRFLWFCVRRSRCLPFGGNLDHSKLEPLIENLLAVVKFAKQAGEVKWGVDTKQVWEKLYPELSEGKPGLLGAITARAEAQVLRMACIYALFDRTTEINPSHLKAALAIWKYAEDSVRYIFQSTALDPLANKISQALASRTEGMTRTEVNNLLGGNYDTTRISAALDELRAAGLANVSRIEGTGGRPRERWFAINGDTEKTE